MIAAALVHPLWQRGGVYEVRMPVTPWRIVSGYFDDPDTSCRHIEKYDLKVEGIYTIVNPTQRDFLARANNRPETLRERNHEGRRYCPSAWAHRRRGSDSTGGHQ